MPAGWHSIVDVVICMPVGWHSIVDVVICMPVGWLSIVDENILKRLLMTQKGSGPSM